MLVHLKINLACTFGQCLLVIWQSGTTGKTLEELKRKLEDDARNVLQFMASNGLKANPSKTTLMVLNGKNKEPMTIEVGESIVTQ